MSRHDQYRYAQHVLESLLPAVWDDEFGILASKAEQEVRSNGDPAHGGDLMAMTADVRRAGAVLHKWDRELLHARYHHGLSFEAIAELAGYESVQEAAECCDLVVAQMLNFLNGGRDD